MELNQLKYFEVVAKYENMSKAAKELNIAQPAISQCMARLEEELGVSLFDRKGKRIFLNEQGRYLLGKVPQMLKPFDTIRNELADVADVPVQHIKLLVQSGSVQIPELLLAFKEQYPQVNFTLSQNEEIKECDVCITSATAPTEPWIDDGWSIILEEELCLAIPAASSLAAMERIPFKVLKGEAFINLEKGRAIREITDDYFKKAGFEPKIIFESDSPGMVRGLIEVGLGIAFYPRITWGPVASDKIVLRPVEDVVCKRYILAKMPGERYVTRIIKAFYHHVRAFYNELGNI